MNIGNFNSCYLCDSKKNALEYKILKELTENRLVRI